MRTLRTEGAGRARVAQRCVNHTSLKSERKGPVQKRTSTLFQFGVFTQRILLKTVTAKLETTVQKAFEVFRIFSSGKKGHHS